MVTGRGPEINAAGRVCVVFICCFTYLPCLNGSQSISKQHSATLRLLYTSTPYSFKFLCLIHPCAHPDILSDSPNHILRLSQNILSECTCAFIFLNICLFLHLHSCVYPILCKRTYTFILCLRMHSLTWLSVANTHFFLG